MHLHIVLLLLAAPSALATLPAHLEKLLAGHDETGSSVDFPHGQKVQAGYNPQVNDEDVDKTLEKLEESAVDETTEEKGLVFGRHFPNQHHLAPAMSPPVAQGAMLHHGAVVMPSFPGHPISFADHPLNFGGAINAEPIAPMRPQMAPLPVMPRPEPVLPVPEVESGSGEGPSHEPEEKAAGEGEKHKHSGISGVVIPEEAATTEAMPTEKPESETEEGSTEKPEGETTEKPETAEGEEALKNPEPHVTHSRFQNFKSSVKKHQTMWIIGLIALVGATFGAVVLAVHVKRRRSGTQAPKRSGSKGEKASAVNPTQAEEGASANK